MEIILLRRSERILLRTDGLHIRCRWSHHFLGQSIPSDDSHGVHISENLLEGFLSFPFRSDPRPQISFVNGI